MTRFDWESGAFVRFYYKSGRKMDLDKLNRYLDNTASEAEMREVLAWLAADEKNRQELNALDKAFCASVLHAPRQKAGARRFPMLRGVVRHVLRAAAVVALILGVGYLVSEYRLVSLAGRMTSLEVPAGHYLSLNLDDGTKVWLNAGARLEYPAAFLRGERRVKVTGEAMFDVAHDADRPFVVETFACDVRVLGTKFAVEADASRSLFSASLLRGSVRIEDRTGRNTPVVLRPDECCSLCHGRLLVSPIDDPDEFLWTEGIISIRGLTFFELMAKFERSFDVEIAVERNIPPVIEYNYGKIRVSDGIDSALRLLQMSCDFTYEKSADNRHITIR